ncbi:MAG: metallophosphoesterase [Clostridiaceae bacterium]|jgi:predicted phosphodiesterase|nr:metallophosphoesterase [Clostridiaceae bacterium]
MAIWITGDTHGDFSRLAEGVFPALDRLTKKDCLIVCGDFGGLWQGGSRERKRLDRLEARPFTTLFVDGNHENFDRLARYPAEEWHGGLVRRVRPSVLHLMRGQMFALEGKRIFTMGGAQSHDIQDGVLERSQLMEGDLQRLRHEGARVRVNHVNWWRQELPSQEEYRQARQTLEKNGWQADYIVTHCAPTSLQQALFQGAYAPDPLTDFLEEIRQNCRFEAWFFGHYHRDGAVGDKPRYILLYEQIVELNKRGD